MGAGADDTGTASYLLLEAGARRIAHALGNPLAGLCLALDLLATGAEPDKYLERAQQLCARLAALKATLGGLGGSGGAVEAVAVGPWLEDVCRGHGQGIDVTLALPADLPAVLGRRDLLSLAMAELLCNAAEAAPARAAVTVTATAAAGWLEIVVADEGPGIAAAVAPAAFVAPCTTKPHAAGIGLVLVGLVVAHLHRGRTRLLTPARGAAVALALPLGVRP